jgi:hypothetical protein
LLVIGKGVYRTIVKVRRRIERSGGNDGNGQGRALKTTMYMAID